MNDLIELSDAELALVTGGGHGSPPARSAGPGRDLGHRLALVLVITLALVLLVALA